MNTIDALELSNWRQFSIVNIDTRSHTTVLTGANGCGKTTILNVISSHFGWNLSFLAVPHLGKKGKLRIYSDILELSDREKPDPGSTTIGSIRYSDSPSCSLLMPPPSKDNPQYQLQYSDKPNLEGLHIPSHRPSMTFQRVDTLPINPKTNQQHYQEFQTLLQQTQMSAKVQNPGMVLKQSLISLALFGYGNQAVAENPEYRELFEGFQEVLKHVLPVSLGFEKLEVRMPDVVLVTKTGTFALDAMSGGVNSVFGITWQIYMYGSDRDGCTVVIDEPENHLHPSMQRTLLPSLEKAFPKNRFIVATHSPFIVTSNPRAKVYALSYDENKKIESRLLEEADLTGSADSVLRDILDVPTTIPVWVETRVRDILAKYDSTSDSNEKIEKIIRELEEAGLDRGALGL